MKTCVVITLIICITIICIVIALVFCYLSDMQMDYQYKLEKDRLQYGRGKQ